MKKSHFAVAALALVLGAGIGISTHFAIEAQANAVVALAEEAQSSMSSEEVTEEEKTKLQSIIDELVKKYDEIKNIQVAGTTIGAIAGALVGAIVSAIPAILNRSNIKKAIEAVDVCQGNVAKTGEVLEVVKEKYDISNANYDSVTKLLGELNDELKATKAALSSAEEAYAVLSKENKDLQEIIIVMANHTRELVGNGTAEMINAKFRSK